MGSEPSTPPSRKKKHQIRKRKQILHTDDLPSSSSSDESSKHRFSHKRSRDSSSSSSSPVRSKQFKSKIKTKKHRKHRSSKRKSRRSSDIDSSILKELVTAIQKNNKVERSLDIRGSENVIPEFDPQFKGQTMKDWISKINEIAHVYGWSQKQIIHYALPKLRGLAKSWYDGLQTVDYNWDQWQEKLMKIFPDEEDYGDLLTDMLSRKIRGTESLEEYYFVKMRFIYRCDLSGKKAVDCLTHGIVDTNTRFNAKGFAFKEPEEVLTYFRKISNKMEESVNDDVLVREHSKITPNSLTTSKEFQSLRECNEKRSGLICFNCGEMGHFWQKCTKPEVRCVKCNRVGHNNMKCEKKCRKFDKP